MAGKDKGLCTKQLKVGNLEPGLEKNRAKDKGEGIIGAGLWLYGESQGRRPHHCWWQSDGVWLSGCRDLNRSVWLVILKQAYAFGTRCHLCYKPGRRSIYIITELHAWSELQGRVNGHVLRSRKQSFKSLETIQLWKYTKYCFVDWRQQHKSQEFHGERITHRDINLPSKLAHLHLGSVYAHGLWSKGTMGPKLKLSGWRLIKELLKFMLCFPNEGNIGITFQRKSVVWILHGNLQSRQALRKSSSQPEACAEAVTGFNFCEQI